MILSADAVHAAKDFAAIKGAADYVHHVPGRLRLKSHAFRGRQREADALRAELQLVQGVKAIETSAITGSVIIHYDEAALPPAALWELLRQRGYVEGDFRSDAGPMTRPELAERLLRSLSRALVELLLERSTVALFGVLV